MLPVLLPLVALLVVAQSKKARQSKREWWAVLLLLGFCLVCRARRLFEYTEWYHFLLEIPAYLWAIQLLFPQPREKVLKALQAGLAGLILAGVYSYWFLGAGSFTRRGVGELLKTPRGSIRVSAEQIQQFQTLEELLYRIDPASTRPLFAFGYTGGFNYCLPCPWIFPAGTCV
jgi:hypothetical protein